MNQKSGSTTIMQSTTLRTCNKCNKQGYNDNIDFLPSRNTICKKCYYESKNNKRKKCSEEDQITELRTQLDQLQQSYNMLYEERNLIQQKYNILYEEYLKLSNRMTKKIEFKWSADYDFRL